MKNVIPVKESTNYKMDFNKIASKCFTNMNQSHKNNKYCDVTIIIEDQKFPCHRLVLSSMSKYFNGMFNDNFDESKAQNITLMEEIDGTTFEVLLNAIYTTNISITPQNAYHLWKACSFLGMPDFENSCVQYIKKNLPVDHLLDVCLFAEMLKEEDLLNTVAKHMAEDIIQLSKIYEFSQLSFDILKLIFSQENLIRDEEVIFSIVVKWVKTMPSVSTESTAELLEAAKLTKISVWKMAQLITKPDSLTEHGTDENNSKISNIQMEVVPGKSNGRGVLKVYMKAFNEDRCSKDTIVLEYNDSNKKWNPVDNLNCSFDNLKTVIIGNRQYFLAYDRNRNSWSSECALFWMVIDGKHTKLNSPPVISHHYHLAVVENRIYLYCSFDSVPSVYISVTSNLIGEKENVRNCVFMYNCDLNVWTSTPQISTSVKGACLISFENMIYIIGGRYIDGNKSYIDPEKSVQRYDYRSSRWTSKSGTYYYFHAASSVYKNKVYLCGNYEPNYHFFSDETENYDFVSQNGEKLKPMKTGRADHLLIHYNNFLYAMDNRQHSPVEKYDVENDTWSDETYFPTTVTLNGFTITPYDVTDAIVQI